MRVEGIRSQDARSKTFLRRFSSSGPKQCDNRGLSHPHAIAKTLNVGGLTIGTEPDLGPLYNIHIIRSPEELYTSFIRLLCYETLCTLYEALQSGT